jgi:DNA-binding GntR family transcriptional regulator
MPVPRDSLPAERVLLRDTAYERLEAAIVDGTLRPGERLRDDELGEWLGVSRTPIREALARLTDAGLVETAANRYTRVAPVAVADSRTSFAIAAALDALVVELAIARLTAATLDALRTENERFTWAVWRDDVDSATDADRRFHAALAAVAGNNLLSGLLGRVLPAVRRLERLAWPALGERPGAQQHEAVLAAAGAGEPSGATRAVSGEWIALGSAVERALRD